MMKINNLLIQVPYGNINYNMFNQIQIIYKMLPQSYQQNYESPSDNLINHTSNYLSYIESSNQKIKMLLNSCRSKNSSTVEQMQQEHQSSRFLQQNRSYRVRNCVKRGGIDHKRNFNSAKERNLCGDSALIHKHHLNPSKYFYGQLSRVGHHPDKASLKAISRLKIPISNKEGNFAPYSYQELNSLQNKQQSYRITKQEEKNLQKKNKKKQSKQIEENQQFQVESINSYLLTSHLLSITSLNFDSNPEQIFTFFQSTHELGNFPEHQNPVIKRYKNFIYYGPKPMKSQKYIGMLWYYNRLWFYGEMLEGKRHGIGIQINLSCSMVWKGKFTYNQKNGYFKIQSPHLKYYGMMSYNQYHGQGHLITANSEYKGNFVQGAKEGIGWEKFNNKSQYKGQYFQNKFDGEGQLKAGGNYYYKGMFKVGKPDGYGFERTDQYEYLGQFVMGAKQGKGIIKTKTGIRMECMFIAGLAVDKEMLSNSPNKYCRQLDKKTHHQSVMLDEISEEETIDPFYALQI